MTTKTISAAEAKGFYDRFGIRQDHHGFEDIAREDMLAHGNWGSARRVLEFGCGTGKLARDLLRDYLPADAQYLGLDVSTTMVQLARERTRAYAGRAQIIQSDGSVRLPIRGTFDRFVSTYVLDLLADADIHTVLDEAYRLLETGGLLCLVGLTHGEGAFARLVEWAWTTAHSIRPVWVGGCRPLALQRFVGPPRWQVRYRQQLTMAGMSSEILVAEKQ